MYVLLNCFFLEIFACNVNYLFQVNRVLEWRWVFFSQPLFSVCSLYYVCISYRCSFTLYLKEIRWPPYCERSLYMSGHWAEYRVISWSSRYSEEVLGGLWCSICLIHQVQKKKNKKQPRTYVLMFPHWAGKLIYLWNIFPVLSIKMIRIISQWYVQFHSVDCVSLLKAG